MPARLLAGGLLLFLLTPLLHAADIPPSPAKEDVGHFTHDAAGLISPTADERITAAQKTAFEQHSTPIIVVTMDRMAQVKHYGSIEDLAGKWFDAWEIGTMRRDGKNQGILVLVSAGDRQARIELGADWGRAWDNHTQRIMDQQMIPHFKRGNYGDGIAAGVEALAQMAETGPAGQPPTTFFPTDIGARIERSLTGDNHDFSAYSFLPPGIIIIAVGIGVGLVVAGIFVESHRSWLIGGGLLLIIVALFTWLAIIVIAVVASAFFNKRDTGRRSGGFFSGGGSGYSGGGFGGGFSGGGGASGRW